MAYSRQIALALRLIQAKGFKGVLRRYTAGSAPSGAPLDVADPTVQTYTFHAVVQLRRANVLQDSTQQPDTILIVAAKSLRTAPRLTDKVVFAGGEHAIRAIETLAPDGTPILYTLVMDTWTTTTP